MPRPLCVGLAGGTGAGKTALARALCDALGEADVLVVPHDAYYRDRAALPPDERERRNYDHPDALDSALLAAHLDALRAGREVERPSYDFALHRRSAETQRLAPRRLIVVDGILVLADARLRARFDLRVFVAARESLRFARRVARDVAERGRSPESVAAQLDATVRPMHAAFVEPSRAFAQLVLENDAVLEDPAAVLVARVRALLQAAEELE